ncbi:hypothetical protein L7F22_015101 [Adiantum nelumboides]|nr:hypothetical protein [Adiantum nelumboides]
MSRFIHLASKLLHPLQRLTQQVEFVWSKELEEYFCSIKDVLLELSTLMPPCWEFTFFVSSSVGKETLRAVLLQQDPHSTRMRSVYFASRVMNALEKSYTEAESMMLSLVFAVRKFRSYLLPKPFIILTAENLFPWVSSQMTLSTRISKWIMELQVFQYSFKVEDSVCAQLARILTYRVHERNIKVPEVKTLPLPPPRILPNAFTLFFDGAFRKATGKAGGGLVLHDSNGEVVMKKHVKLPDSTSNSEVETTYYSMDCRLREKAQAIRRLFNQFEEVQLYHIPRKQNEVADLLAQKAVACDESEVQVILAGTAIKQPRFGTPLEIVSDNGSEFRKGLLTEACEELHILHRHSTPYYPQSNGLVEKANGIIAGIIMKMVKNKTKLWDDFLDGALWGYRSHRVHTISLGLWSRGLAAY